MRVNVIGACHFRWTASFLADQTPAHRERQMHQLSVRRPSAGDELVLLCKASTPIGVTEAKLPVHVRTGNVPP